MPVAESWWAVLLAVAAGTEPETGAGASDQRPIELAPMMFDPELYPELAATRKAGWVRA